MPEITEATIREIRVAKPKRGYRRIKGVLGFPYRPFGTPTDVAFFQSRSIPEPNTGCWLWLGCCDEEGYAVYNDDSGKKAKATRVAASLNYGGHIPPDLQALHKCDQPGCVNPDHLYFGTNTDNQRDAVRRGRHRALKGDLSPLAKLTWPQVEAIRSDPRKHREIAAQYGVVAGTIGKIKRGEKWAI